MALKKKSVKAAGKEATPKAGAEAKETPKVEPEKKEGNVEKSEAAAALVGGKTPKQLRNIANRKKQKELAKKDKDTPKAEVTDKMREEATKKAIDVIKTGLTEEGAKCQKKGYPYTPDAWVSEFKDILGSYMKFVERCKEFVVVQGDRPGRYTVHLAGDAIDLPDAERLKPKRDWELRLRNAWQIYLQSTPKAERKPEEFVEVARKMSAVVSIGTDASAGAAKATGAKDDAEDKPKRKAAPADDAPKKKKAKKA